MMKKKSMAVAMAAVTVATTVAPAFANTAEKTVVNTGDAEKLGALKAEIKGYLETTYVDNADLLRDPKNAGKSVYTVKAKVNGTVSLDDTDKITEMKELDRLIANLKDNDYIDISVVDNGSKEIDGNRVDYKVSNYKADELDAVQTTAAGLTGLVKSVDRINKDTVSLELLNNETPLVIKTGDVKLVLEADSAIYKKNDLGMNLDKDGKITKDPAEFVVEGFKTAKAELEAKADENDKEYDYDATAKEFAIKKGDVIAKEFNTSDLFDGKIGRITSTGYKLIDYITAYNKADKVADQITAEIAEDKLSLVINVPVEKKDVKSIAAVGNYATIKVNGSSNEVAAFAKVFAHETGIVITGVTAKEAAISTFAGKNRQETAIKVSEQLTKELTTTKHKNIVLVSDYAIADGLAATPFAKQNDASILLTGKDAISEEVMKEILRVANQKDNEGKVYLVGGDAVLSKNIETQLYNAGIETDNIERIKGKNREETSLKIAEKMAAYDKANTITTEEVFVAGGRAEADAMSIANIAALKGAPILLANENTGLSEDQVEFIEANKTNTAEAFVVGGEAKVPAAVEAQVKGALDKSDTVERLKGKNRQETNAVVINEFVKTLDKVYVAKSDDKGLVDALPGGVLAAKNNTAVVLATNELNEKQEVVLTNLKNKDAEKTQIGHGIAAKVWESINAIFNK